MTKALWKGETIAQSDRCESVEGNAYFPPEDVKMEFLRPSSTTTVCAWKGTSSYFDLEVKGQTNKDAAWTYKEPKAEASNIKGHIAFWKGVEIQNAPAASESASAEGEKC